MKRRENHPSRKARMLGLYCLFLISLFLGVAVIGEVAVRVFVPRHKWSFRTAFDDWRRDDEIGWTNKPRLDVESRYDGRTLVRFRTNQDGLQPPEAATEKKPGRPRIMLVGDSTIVGRAVPESERLAPQLERMLAEKNVPCEVTCAGVQGYSTDQCLLLLRRLLPKYHPDLVIHLICRNDLGGNEMGVVYDTPKPRFRLDQDGALVFSAPDAGLMNKAWSTGPVRSSFRSLAQASAFYRLLLPGILSLRSSGDWRQQNTAFAIPASEPADDDSHDNWRLFQTLLATMDKTCRELGSKLMLTQHPSMAEVWLQATGEDRRFSFEKRIASTAMQLKIPFCPVIRRFLDSRSEGPFHLSAKDDHCNGKGYEITARHLATWLAANSMARTTSIPAASPAPAPST